MTLACDRSPVEADQSSVWAANRSGSFSSRRRTCRSVVRWRFCDSPEERLTSKRDASPPETPSPASRRLYRPSTPQRSRSPISPPTSTVVSLRAAVPAVPKPAVEATEARTGRRVAEVVACEPADGIFVSGGGRPGRRGLPPRREGRLPVSRRGRRRDRPSRAASREGCRAPRRDRGGRRSRRPETTSEARGPPRTGAVARRPGACRRRRGRSGRRTSRPGRTPRCAWRALRPASRCEGSPSRRRARPFPRERSPRSARHAASPPRPRSGPRGTPRRRPECRRSSSAVFARPFPGGNHRPLLLRTSTGETRGQLPEGPIPSMAFTMWRAIDGFSLSLRVEYAYQSRPKGT